MYMLKKIIQSFKEEKILNNKEMYGNKKYKVKDLYCVRVLQIDQLKYENEKPVIHTKVVDPTWCVAVKKNNVYQFVVCHRKYSDVAGSSYFWGVGDEVASGFPLINYYMDQIRIGRITANTLLSIDDIKNIEQDMNWYVLNCNKSDEEKEMKEC